MLLLNDKKGEKVIEENLLYVSAKSLIHSLTRVYVKLEYYLKQTYERNINFDNFAVTKGC